MSPIFSAAATSTVHSIQHGRTHLPGLLLAVTCAIAACCFGLADAAAGDCGLNGRYDHVPSVCICDPGWKGDECGELDLGAASPVAYGLASVGTPTWGGGAVFERGRWHLIVGSRAEDAKNNTKEDYPCDSKIVRAVSATADPAGPYTITGTLFPRSSWEPALARAPNGSLVVMFFGNISGPPAVGSPACLIPSESYNLTTTTTYIAVSPSGSVTGPFSDPVVVHGMENAPDSSADPYRWHCASGNPSPAFHPNGTLYAAMRQNPCWKGFPTREHIGLWRADSGFTGGWTLVSPEPLYGWGTGSERNCSDDGCPSHEDPHLWIDDRGYHLLTHDQNHPATHSVRGGYGYSLDGHRWTLLTTPAASNASAWPPSITWSNGSSTMLVRRQRPSFIRDPDTNRITHLISGADFNHHAGTSKTFCDGCHWGTGITLIQPIREKLFDGR